MQAGGFGCFCQDARGAGSLSLDKVCLQGEILETNLACTDFWLGLTKATLQKKKETGEEGCFAYSVHLPVSAGEQEQIKNNIGKRWEAGLRRDLPDL